MITKDNRVAYWKDNLRLVTICLVIWFVVSYLFGIVLAEPLNSIRLGVTNSDSGSRSRGPSMSSSY